MKPKPPPIAARPSQTCPGSALAWRFSQSGNAAPAATIGQPATSPRSTAGRPAGTISPSNRARSTSAYSGTGVGMASAYHRPLGGRKARRARTAVARNAASTVAGVVRLRRILALFALLSATAVAAAGLDHAASGVTAHRGAVVMRVTALTDSVLRVRIGRDGALPEDASWAVPAEARARSVPVTATADGFATASVAVHLDPATLALTLSDRAGHVIVADAAEPLALDGRAFTLRKAMPIAEHYVGLGDKTGGSIDRRGGSFVDWNTDEGGFTAGTDPIYKSIPFVIGVGGEGGSWGLFLDNTWRAAFDFGRREADTLAIGANDGPIDYYLIAGPATRDVVRRYTDLTGRAPLPPRWALGYQQSRYSYGSAAEVRSVADRLRAEKVPTDVLWLDIGYLDRNTPFTVDRAAFPDLPGLIRDERAQGFKRRHHHRPPRRCQPSGRQLCAVRQRQRRSTPGSSAATARSMSRRSGRGRRCSPTSPCRGCATGGARCSQTQVDDGRRRQLERHERAGDLRDADQDHAARQPPPHRR